MEGEQKNIGDPELHDIEHGEAAAKVDFPDPAAAPLGGESESAGTAPSRKAVAKARGQETAPSEPANDNRGSHDHRGNSEIPHYDLVLIIAVPILLFAIMLILAIISSA